MLSEVHSDGLEIHRWYVQGKELAAKGVFEMRQWLHMGYVVLSSNFKQN